MSGAAAAMAQVNVRVNRQVKERAEEALRLSGTSLQRVIKRLVDTIAQGGDRCEEVLEAIEPVEQSRASSDSPFAVSWAAADQLHRNLGIALDLGSDDRDWGQVYSEAMDDHYRRKGLYS